jgi:hypothetical protein
MCRLLPLYDVVSIDDNDMYTGRDYGFDDTEVDTRHGTLSQAVAMVSKQEQEEEDQIQGMQEVFMASTIIAIVLSCTHDRFWWDYVEGRVDITARVR